MSGVRLLVTRPEAEGEETAARLRALGHDVLVAPLLRIELIADADIGLTPIAGIIMTSRNAARAIERHSRITELRALPVFAVGRRTAAAALSAGFSDVSSADGDADDLIGMIRSRRAGLAERLLYLAGADRAVDMAGILRQTGLSVDTVVIYRAVAADELPDAVRAALSAGRLDGALHFSRRSAEIFLACARRDGVLDCVLLLKHFCLSAQVAAPLTAAGVRDVAIAHRPDETALIALLTA